MHLHLPKPLHGWREFIGEVGIIVIGVLIALAAEQAVEWFHWQLKVRDTEQAIRRDLALAADVASERVAIKRCLDDRLTLLREMLELPSATAALPPETSGYPMTRTYRAPTRAWNTELWTGMVADGTVQHLDPERARALNLLYLTIESARDANREEKIASTDLWVLGDNAVRVSSDKRVELLQLIDRLSRINDELNALSRQILRRISDLGDLPPINATENRLAGDYSRAMQCKYAHDDLNHRILAGWFTLHR